LTRRALREEGSGGPVWGGRQRRSRGPGAATTGRRPAGCDRTRRGSRGLVGGVQHRKEAVARAPRCPLAAGPVEREGNRPGLRRI
jgi:hypothetical protein